VLKLAVSFKDRPKKSAKHYVLKDHKNEKNHKTKKVWVLKEKQVEEVKMLSEKFDEPLLDLDKYCFMNSLISCKALLMILLSMFTKMVLDLT
jgi:hypothetical protein